MSKIIRAKNLIHDYPKCDDEGNVIGSYRALDDVNIDIEQGSFVAVLGHNGSGKSTFAKHLNAILYPTEGTVWVNGYDTANDDDVWNIRQSAGMVFQNPDNQIIGTMVEEDVAFGPENIGVDTEEILKRVTKALKAVGMNSYRNHSPNKLSGGQKQRVAIAGVLAMKPKCIILDEPTAMLDPIGRKEVIATIKALNKSHNITVILITHYMDEVIDADMVYVMNKARVEMQGTPREIFSDVDKLKEIGLDVPQVTELAYELRKKGIPMREGILTIDEFVEEYGRLRG